MLKQVQHDGGVRVEGGALGFPAKAGIQCLRQSFVPYAPPDARIARAPLPSASLRLRAKFRFVAGSRGGAER